MFPSALFSLWASVLCVFLLFVTFSTSLSLLFPTQLAYGNTETIHRFYLFLKLKMVALPLLALVFAIALGAAARKRRETYVSPKETTAMGPAFWVQGAVYVLIAGWLTGYILFVSMSGGDEGIRTNVARNLVLYSLYALGQPGSFQIFSPLLSAGPTVILPLALLYKYVGDGTLVTRVYEQVWNLAAWGMLYVLYRQMLRGGKLFLALLLSIAFLLHPRMEDGYATLMGDTAVFFFLALALQFLPDFGERKRFEVRSLLSGVFLGFAIVTKLVVAVAGILPFAFLLFGFNRRKEIIWKPFLIFISGMVLPFLAWLIIKEGFTNTSFAKDNMFLFSSYALFGIRELPRVIARYGYLNFLKLGILLAAATLYIGKALKERRVGSGELAMYAFSLTSVLFFFLCTHGQILRYNFHAILFLIPLAVKALPGRLTERWAGKTLAIFSLGFVLLFHSEIRNIGQIVLLKRTRELPWMTDQLKEKVKGISDLPTIWTADDFDGCYLSALLKPPVFWMRESMFLEKPRPITHPFQLNQTNIPVGSQPPLPIPALKKGDLLAVGVNRVRNQERELYLLTVVHTPPQRGFHFIVEGRLPSKLGGTLKRRLNAMGLEVKFVGKDAVRDPDVYWLKFFA